MSKRVTLLIDDELYKKLLFKQAKEIKKTSTRISFSKIVVDILKKHV
ncbi:hypothetical protein [Nitrosopumilus sp. S6]